MDKRNHNSLEYYLWSDNPQILLLSGMHGDEYASGALFESYLQKSAASLPSFIYIPKVSPTAVKQHTRINAYGNDINRQFFPDTTDPEAQTIMSLLSHFKCNIAIDIHEDPDQSKAFYLYDSGRMTESELIAYRSQINQTKAHLYTGMDDLDDENLACQIHKGYYSFRQNWMKEDISSDAGFSSKWLIRNNVVQRVFTLEIPGKATLQLKQFLIEMVIPFLATTFDVQ